MKSFIAILLLAGILLQSFSKVFIFVNYQVNKEYISKNLCENRSKPKSCCKGSCQLTKQMKEVEKRENAPVNNLKEKFELSFFSIIVFRNVLQPYLNTAYTHIPFLIQETIHVSTSVFHPPSFSLS